MLLPKDEGFDRAFVNGKSENGVGPMNLIVWLPAMFVLGLASLGVCLAFVSACDRI
jgi:hypothetical protein